MKTHTKTLLRRGALSLLLLGAPLTVRAAETRDVAPAATERVAADNVLAWTEWELTAPVYAGLEKRPFLKFTDTRLGASVGCNSIGGAYTIEGEQITIKELMSTRMACSEPLMKAEGHYSKALQSARSFTVSADGQSLTLRGDQALSFRLTGRTTQGFVPAETKIINVAPQLGPELDGDKTPKYLQLEDLSEGISWGRFSEEKILGFDFVPGYRYQMRVAVERDARSGEKRLRLLEILSQQWMQTAKLEANNPEKPEKVVTEADNGSTVTLNASEVLVVRLEDNPSTGYSRALVSFPDMPIRLVSHQMVAQAPASVNGTPVVGAPSIHEWKFVVAGQAAFGRTAWLKFLRLRPFDKGIDTAGLWEIKVTVPQSPAQ